MKEILITAMAVTSAKPFKVANPRNPFALAVTYTLADGQKIVSAITAEKKKELPDTLTRREQAIAAQACAFSFQDDGGMGMMVESWNIGTNDGKLGMVPDPRVDAIGYKAPAQEPMIEGCPEGWAEV